MTHSYFILEDVYNWMITKGKNIKVSVLKEKASKIKEGDFLIFSVKNNPKKWIKVKVLKKNSINTIEDFYSLYGKKQGIFYPPFEREIYNQIIHSNKVVTFTFQYITSNLAENTIHEILSFGNELFYLKQKLFSSLKDTVDFIINTKVRDKKKIECTLDYLLECCYDEESISYYKKLCDYYATFNAKESLYYQKELKKQL